MATRDPSYLTLICVKIVHKLICEDYIIMNEGQYVILSSLLGHRDEWFRGQVEGLLREQFLPKCQRSIASYFIASIMNYNKYKVSHRNKPKTQNVQVNLCLKET